MEYCNFVKYFYFILLLIFFTAILLRLASNGERVTEIQSVDDSAIVAFCEHDCNSSTTRSSSGNIIISHFYVKMHEKGIFQSLETPPVLLNVI